VLQRDAWSPGGGAAVEHDIVGMAKAEAPPAVLLSCTNKIP
jgi:hypothetical protein